VPPGVSLRRSVICHILHSIYVFCIILRINVDDFHNQHTVITGPVMCMDYILCEKETGFLRHINQADFSLQTLVIIPNYGYVTCYLKTYICISCSFLKSLSEIVTRNFAVISLSVAYKM
jgi:hypothetical protein